MASSASTPNILTGLSHCRSLSNSVQTSSRSTAPQAWSDENYDSGSFQQHFGDAHGNIISTPVATTTTFPFGRNVAQSHSSEELVTPRQLKAHLRSLTPLQRIDTNITYSGRTTLGTGSPQKQENGGAMPTLTGTKGPAQTAPARGLTGWFSNTCTPSIESSDLSTPTTVSAAGKLRNMSIPVAPTASATKSKFSFFSPKPAQPATPTAYDDDDDILLNLSLSTALTPTPHDPFSPASSKNLHTSALTLLATFQSALRAGTTQIRDLRAEAAARAEERDAADTRTQHLKAQLADMAARVAEQEGTLKSILGELVEERRRGAEERERSSKGEATEGAGVVLDQKVPDRRSGSSEDLGVGGWKGAEESDAESAVESVWSRCGSPDGNRTSRTSGGSAVTSASSAREPLRRGGGKEEVVVVRRCDHCEGKAASAAWVAVRDLREENKELKREAGVLREAMDEVIEMVSVVGLR
ncbi:hypothetical protein VC83_00596 [Pseudogymnoascus destructans]|uniref:Uncharacterized protein n=2 Tax=Pseudogymnoascus destructans TaxID=655981 RepID=L8GBR4_PSED2|nr:uncharacterized protein VC83_00596 [Pseudogymnoascus destructans]ELR09486.1 hypothetical protein GMDG_00668 [Pseudogymnoascus destructans 20631-21]OAF63090.1 hypothetical protein VC83_00596 [Pseudogymnoascus destructans]